MRTRPIFDEWTAVIEVEHDDEILSEEQLHQVLVAAGQQVGIGDWRPRFGRFSVVTL